MTADMSLGIRMTAVPNTSRNRFFMRNKVKSLKKKLQVRKMCTKHSVLIGLGKTSTKHFSFLLIVQMCTHTHSRLVAFISKDLETASA